MAKFKVGDKVRILDASKIVGAAENGFKTGEIYDVDEINMHNNLVINLLIKNGKVLLLILKDELQYIEKVEKTTKNQRITALEKEIAELRYFKELAQEMEDNSFHDLERIREIEGRLEHLEQAVQQYFTVPGESSTVEDKPKTPNQQRKEIIEKAKEFTKEIKDSEFIVNEPKRTIVLFTRFPNSTKISRRIIVKCHPDDVFNSHIGKAIALGRALRKDVSEFENAVQPSHYAVGQIGISKFIGYGLQYRVDVIGTGRTLTKLFGDKGKANADTRVPLSYDDGIQCALKIINDTNAQYGGEMK